MLFHRSPTIRRPVTFLTVQKSAASSSTQRMNRLTKLLKKTPPNRYTRMASVCGHSQQVAATTRQKSPKDRKLGGWRRVRTLNNTWKNAGTGCASPAARSEARLNRLRAEGSSRDDIRREVSLERAAAPACRLIRGREQRGCCYTYLRCSVSGSDPKAELDMSDWWESTAMAALSDVEAEVL